MKQLEGQYIFVFFPFFFIFSHLAKTSHSKRSEIKRLTHCEIGESYVYQKIRRQN